MYAKCFACSGTVRSKAVVMLLVFCTCVCSMFFCALLYVISSFAIILMGRRVLVVLLCLSSWCLVIVIVLWLFPAEPLYGLQCVIVVLPAHTHSLCFVQRRMIKRRLKIHQTVQNTLQMRKCIGLHFFHNLPKVSKSALNHLV